MYLGIMPLLELSPTNRDHFRKCELISGTCWRQLQQGQGS